MKINNNDGFEKLNYLQKEIKFQAVKKKLCKNEFYNIFRF